MSVTASQPLQTLQSWPRLYQVYRLTLRLMYLPVWTILSFIPHTRPRPTWNFKQSLTLHICHDMVDTEALTGVTEELTMDQGRDLDRFQVIDPFPLEFYQGPLFSSSVMPKSVGGVWFPAMPKAIDPKSTVALYIHGGAFVTGNGRSDTCGRPANYLLQNAGVDSVFSVQYRLSGYGGRDPFPAALQDIVTAYLYLLRTLEIPSSSVVVVGNSSGANLVIAFLRYIEHMTPQINRPMCAAALSPWVAPLETAAPDYRRTKDYSAEYVAESFHQWGSRTYQPPEGVRESDMPYITLLGHPFSTSVPVLATFGEFEALGADIAAWATEMRAIKGNSVQIYCDVNGIHASIFVGEAMGWGSSAQQVCLKIKDLIQTTRDALPNTA